MIGDVIPNGSRWIQNGSIREVIVYEFDAHRDHVFFLYRDNPQQDAWLPEREFLDDFRPAVEQ